MKRGIIFISLTFCQEGILQLQCLIKNRMEWASVTLTLLVLWNDVYDSEGLCHTAWHKVLQTCMSGAAYMCGGKYGKSQTRVSLIVMRITNAQEELLTIRELSYLLHGALMVFANCVEITTFTRIFRTHRCIMYGVKYSEIALRCGYIRNGIHGIELSASFVWMEEVVCGRYGWWEWWHRLSLGSRCTNPPPTPRLTSARGGSLSPALQHPGSAGLVFLHSNCQRSGDWYESTMNRWILLILSKIMVANNLDIGHFNN